MIYMMSKQLPVCFPCIFKGLVGGGGGGQRMVLKSGFFFRKGRGVWDMDPAPPQKNKKIKKKAKSNIFAVGGRFKQIMIIYLPLFFFYIVLK